MIAAIYTLDPRGPVLQKTGVPRGYRYRFVKAPTAVRHHAWHGGRDGYRARSLAPRGRRRPPKNRPDPQQGAPPTLGLTLPSSRCTGMEG